MKQYKKPEIEIAEVKSLHAIMEVSLLLGSPITTIDPPEWGE